MFNKETFVRKMAVVGIILTSAILILTILVELGFVTEQFAFTNISIYALAGLLLAIVSSFIERR